MAWSVWPRRHGRPAVSEMITPSRSPVAAANRSRSRTALASGSRGKSKIDSVLYEQRDAIASDLVKSIQGQLDRLKTGIVIVNVNVQSVQPPEQVQAAFEDTLKADAVRPTGGIGFVMPGMLQPRSPTKGAPAAPPVKPVEP